MAMADNRTIVNYPNYGHLPGTTSQTNTTELNAHQNKMPVYVIRDSACNAHQTLGCNCKYKGNAVVNGGVKVIANDDAMVDNQNSAQSSGATSHVGTVGSNAHPSPGSNLNPAGNAKKHKALGREKPKTIGEPPPNAHLSSVHSLLSTGIFDGALVKYILKRRDINLSGVIKGPKILCSCNACNNSEYMSPYKFELHAGGRTKHPNACIYFENGKTVYEVLQALRDTPGDMLFDAIINIAGSAVSWPHFHLWRGHKPYLTEFYLAGTPTLQQYQRRTKFHQLRNISNLPREES